MANTIGKIVNKLKEQSDTVNSLRSAEIMEMAGKTSEKAEMTAQMAAKAGRKVLKGTTAGILVASIILGMAFSGANEITADQAGLKYDQPPVIMDIGDFGNTTVDDEDEDATDEKSSKVSLVSRFKQAILSLPQSVRLIVVMPLWILGTGILTMISFLWSTLFASPLGGFIMSAFAGFAIITGLFAATAKVLFPDIPLRKILTKRNILAVGVVSLGLAGLDAVAPMFWHDYPFVAGVVKFGVGAGIVAILCMRVRLVFYRDKYKNLPQAAL